MKWRPTNTVRFRPTVELLEDRIVPFVVGGGIIKLPSPAPLPLYTEYSQIAELFPRHDGPTTLYLNFDGWNQQGVAPFATTTGNRDRDIQDILFRTAEVFSPFDVQVERTFGDGAHGESNGATTVFIGDNVRKGVGPDNTAGGLTPGQYSDFPGNVKGLTHRPNSDPYDLAFVDPIDARPGYSLDNPRIVRSVAHESGHTFGLVHVDSALRNDVMNYSSGHYALPFADVSLPVTNKNADSVSDDALPKWRFNSLSPTYQPQTQNSYRFLTAVLGQRGRDNYGHVVHTDAVQYMTTRFGPVVNVGTALDAAIERAGDYDVFRFIPTVTQTVTITAHSLPGPRLNTTLLVYRDYTVDPVASDSNHSAADPRSQVTFTFQAGRTYSIVVGAVDGTSAGGYRLLVGAPDPDMAGPRVSSIAIRSLGFGGLRTLTITFNKSVIPETFRAGAVTIFEPNGVTVSPWVLSEVPGSFQRQYTVTLSLVLPGRYTIRIGPNVNDFAGNPMNQDGDAVNGEPLKDVFSFSFTIPASRLGGFSLP
jgi:hypothetical protein